MLTSQRQECLATLGVHKGHRWASVPLQGEMGERLSHLVCDGMTLIIPPARLPPQRPLVNERAYEMLPNCLNETPIACAGSHQICRAGAIHSTDVLNWLTAAAPLSELGAKLLPQLVACRTWTWRYEPQWK